VARVLEQEMRKLRLAELPIIVSRSRSPQRQLVLPENGAGVKVRIMNSRLNPTRQLIAASTRVIVCSESRSIWREGPSYSTRRMSNTYLLRREVAIRKRKHLRLDRRRS
jgi:hypothetical protein